MARLVVFLVLGTVWVVFGVLTFIYGNPDERLQDIGRVVLMAGVFIMAGSVIVGRIQRPAAGQV